MNNKAFEHPVYKKYFGNLKNVRIVPQEKQDKKPERENVHYPLAREIAQGKLIQYKGFDSYIHENVLVLCNLRINTSHDEGKEIRPWKKKNPDITVLTSRGEFTAFECKNEAKFSSDDIDRMAKTLITIMDLAGPYTLSNKTSKDSWSKWSFLYKTCYEKEDRFPSLRDSLNGLFSLKDFEAKQRWAELVMKCIKGSKFRYVIAFAGSSKRGDIQEMMRIFGIKIKEQEPKLTDYVDKIYLLSFINGRVHNFTSVKDYLVSAVSR